MSSVVHAGVAIARHVGSLSFGRSPCLWARSRSIMAYRAAAAWRYLLHVQYEWRQLMLMLMLRAKALSAIWILVKILLNPTLFNISSAYKIDVKSRDRHNQYWSCHTTCLKASLLQRWVASIPSWLNICLTKAFTQTLPKSSLKEWREPHFLLQGSVQWSADYKWDVPPAVFWASQSHSWVASELSSACLHECGLPGNQLLSLQSVLNITLCLKISNPGVVCISVQRPNVSSKLSYSMQVYWR